MRAQTRVPNRATRGRSARGAKRGAPEAASTAAARILQAALKEDCTAQELSDMACGDPAFAGRVLAWVNSSALQLSRKVMDVRQATSLLGIRGLRNVALGMVLSDLVPNGHRGQVLLANGLRRAIAAKSIAESVAPQHADAAFTVGLFLEAGLLSFASESLEGAHELALGPAAHRPVQERALGRTPHPELGAQIAKGYALADEIVQAVLHHHAEDPPEPMLSRIGWAAERIAAVFEGGVAKDVQHSAEFAAKALGLSHAQLEQLMDTLPGLVEDGARIFEREVGEQRSHRDLLLDASKQLHDLNTRYLQSISKLEHLVDEKERLIEEKAALTRKLEAANEKLHELASVDSLTGLSNRRVVERELANHIALAARQGTELTVAMVDLDHFKQINDTHGHAVGDEVLRVVSDVLQGSIRASDLVARFGGEEFLMVLPSTNLEQAAVVLQRARTRIAETPILTGGVTVKVTASLGASSTRGADPNDSQDALVKRADQALYAAKHAGRNNVQLKPR